METWMVSVSSFLAKSMVRRMLSRDSPGSPMMKDASRLLREHLRQYPGHSSAGAALYFLGRYLERSGDVAGARVCYRKLAAELENHYYAMLARERLKAAGPSAAAAAGEIAPVVF